MVMNKGGQSLFQRDAVSMNKEDDVEKQRIANKLMLQPYIVSVSLAWNGEYDSVDKFAFKFRAVPNSLQHLFPGLNKYIDAQDDDF